MICKPQSRSLLRKRRNGHWSMSQQGTGSVQGGSGFSTTDIKDDAADDAKDDDGDDDDESQDTGRQEAIKRRIQNKKLRKENERLRAQMAEAGKGDGDVGPDRSEVVLGLVEAGMSKDRVRAAVKLIDWSAVDDVEEAIDELRSEHPFLFEQALSAKQDKSDLPGTGSSHRGRRKPSGPSDDELRRKYPSLGR